MRGTKFAVYLDTTLIGEFTTDSDGLIELDDIEPGTYTVKEIATDDEHIVQGCPQSIEVKSGEYRLIFFNKSKPGINIKKIDSETREPLSGAVFRISQTDGSFEREYTTDDSGEIDLSGLEPGSYVVTEIKTPDGYVIDASERVIEINGNEYAAFVFTDTKKPSVKVVKIDAATNERLSGATVRIENLDSGEIIEKITDKSGEILLENLECGAYAVKEINAPEDYLLNTETYNIKAEAGGEYKIVIPDTKRPSLKIIKYDSKSGETIPGTLFSVYRDGGIMGTYSTDENGEILLYNLQPGTYTVTEIASDESHIVNSTPQTIEITENSGDTAVLIFLNDQKPCVRIVKLDSQTLKPLQGAMFEIWSVGGSFKDTYTTDQNGEILIKNMDEGAYSVTEIRAPDGYVADSAGRTINVQRLLHTTA